VKPWREFGHWRRGLEYALDGGLWLHRFTLRGRAWAHLVSTDREALLEVGQQLDIPTRAALQYRPLRDPRTGQTAEAWHWDLTHTPLERALAGALPKVPFGQTVTSDRSER
jgi:hypothetical protein